MLIVFITPTKVMADDKSYDIDKLIINAQITENGDVNVEEELSYTFHGNFNGVYRDLIKKGSSGFTVSKVTVTDKNNNETPINFADSSGNNTYQIINSDDKSQIKIFSKSENESKTFLLNYTIHDAAVKYKDLSELYWNFYSVENSIPVKNVEINVSLMNSEFNSDSFKYWLYTDDSNFTTSYDAGSIEIKGSDLTSLIGIKLHFQPDFLQNPKNNYGDKNYQDVKRSEQLKKQGTFAAIVLIVASVIGLIVFVLRRKSKRYKEALQKYRQEYNFFSEQSVDTPPSDISPALVNLLLSEKKVEVSVIPSVLFYLCRKGYYIIEQSTNTNNKTQNAVESLNYVRNYRVHSEGHLKAFANWLMYYEDNGRINLASIEKKIKSSSGALEFNRRFKDWNNVVVREAESLGFYHIIEGRKVLSNKTYDEKLKWLAYKKYIMDNILSGNQTADLENVDDILIYAAALDVNRESLKGYAESLSQSYDSNYEEDSMYYYPFFYSNLLMWDNVQQDINNYSSSDSDSGFGGYSGGGDFTGGGGGGSGAF